MKKGSVVDEFRSWVDWTSRNLPQLPTNSGRLARSA